MPGRDKEKAKIQYRDWFLRNKEKRQAYTREHVLITKYGITQNDYIKMLLEQKGVCAICGLPETTLDKRSGQIKLLSVDHCHTTGKVRGLLCNHCNHGIGKFRDSIDNLQAAIKYLERN
jgi:hypothetical protein